MRVMKVSPELLASIRYMPVMSSRIIMTNLIGTEVICFLIKPPGMYFVRDMGYKEV